MNKHQSGKRPDPLGFPMPDEALAAYVSLGCQLAAQMAEANFRSIAALPGWTMAQVEDETERAIERMENRLARHAGSERRGSGRRAVARDLERNGVPIPRVNGGAAAHLGPSGWRYAPMNAPRVNSAELRGYRSGRTGPTDFAGHLGRARVVMLRDDQAECMGREVARWNVLLEEPVPRESR